MSDGTKIFDALKLDGPGISPNQEFASGVDAEMQSQMFPGSDPARGPPKKTFKRPKAKKSKTSNQIVGDRNTDSPAFKKWFGDSKLVNDDGSPMVLFHGTNKNRREQANINVDSMTSLLLKVIKIYNGLVIILLQTNMHLAHSVLVKVLCIQYTLEPKILN